MKTVNLESIKTSYQKKLDLVKRVVVCAGTGCVANNSLKVYDAIFTSVKAKGLDVVVELKEEEEDLIYVSKSGCQGFCQMGPLVTIYPEGIVYTKVKVEDVEEMIDLTIEKGQIVERLLYKDDRTNEFCPTEKEIMFYSKQNRYVLKNCGIVEPESINEYIARDGYFAGRKACLEMDAKTICQQILDSGLRGRGGGGFPTGRKWDLTRVQSGEVKYVICNGDEGDPGAFMDRSIMEGNPHVVIEGMIITAMAIGATFGYVYVRAEYPLAVNRMKKACEDAREAGILGENIFGSGKNFDIIVMEGAGAFVCGEETALMSSIEGKRGMPAPKPPFPAQKGLFGKPTVINNVETLATVPLILFHGVDSFRQKGDAKATGTKTFALTGHVVNTGLIEVPFGTTLRKIIGEIAGGVTDSDGNYCGTDYKAVQIGGPSGGCLTQEHLDLPLEYDSLQSVGAMVGSGGLVVMNQDTCMVSLAKYFMQFTQNESCGKCVLCREGTKQMLAILDDIVEGRADDNTLDLLEELAQMVSKGSLCGLGKTAPSPVLSTMRHFKDEYIAHVKDKKCPAQNCKSLMDYKIIEKLCKGCSLCQRKCPASAITGEKGKAYSIDVEKCIKCEACVSACKFNAITMA